MSSSSSSSTTISTVDSQGQLYTPQNQIEKEYFDYLWYYHANINYQNEPLLGGQNAVKFFQLSGVDKGFLKQIWGLSTPLATMDIYQFYIALRFITMIQNGEFPISIERLMKTIKTNLGLPKFHGIDVPKPKPQVPQQQQPSSLPPSLPPSVVVPPNYAIIPAEHYQYHTIFMSYDHERIGYLLKDHAITILQQSYGLDINTLNTIVTIADYDNDAKLLPKEICVAIHLIFCITR